MPSCLEAMGWEFGYFEKQSVGNKMPKWELAADRGLWDLNDPRLSNPAKMRKKYCWVNIAVCPRLQLISHTQPTSTLSRIKCDRYIFIKCICSFIEVRHYVWLCSCSAKFFKIPKRNFIFARVKTGQTGTWSLVE